MGLTLADRLSSHVFHITPNPGEKQPITFATSKIYSRDMLFFEWQKTVIFDYLNNMSGRKLSFSTKLYMRKSRSFFKCQQDCRSKEKTLNF